MSDIVVLEDRMAKFEKKMNAHRRALGRVERKVFNGFGIKIDAINEKVESNRHDNEIAHAEIKKVLGGFIKFGATALVLIFIALIGILGSIWLLDRQTSNPVPEEVVLDAPFNPIIPLPE